MQLSYRDPQFWKKFCASHWQPRVPTVIRQPFKSFPFSEDLLLRALQDFAAGVRADDHRKPCLLSIDDKEKPPRAPLRTLFREESRTLADLEKRCGGVFAKKPFGLMVTQMQATHPGIWHGMAAFLQDAQAWIGTPATSALDLFYGNYSSTFTGLHKDTQDIFAFVIRGKKRMLAWPFEYFLDRVDGISSADRYFNMRLPFDHRPFRKDAIVLDAEPGDIIHWPSDYWHVSEVQKKQFSAMISLGLFFPKAIQSTGRSPLSLKSAVVSGDVSAEIPRAGAAEHLRWMSGFGFKFSVPPLEAKRAKVPAGLRYVKNYSSLILWTVDKARINVATNGHTASVNRSTKCLKTLAQLASGEIVTGNEGASPATFSETSYNPHCRLKTRRRKVASGTVALLDWLRRAHAVDVINP